VTFLLIYERPALIHKSTMPHEEDDFNLFYLNPFLDKSENGNSLPLNT
jgi:hypothetical protein